MNAFILVILVVHGLIHTMGFVKSVNPSLIPQLKMPVPKAAGIFWLLAAVLFLCSALFRILSAECWWISATRIDPRIQWEPVDPLTVKARFTNDTISISAPLKFNEKGELVDFVSDDRYYCEDGRTYLAYQWSTPVRNYVEINGRRVPSYGEAAWLTPEGSFAYAKFDLKEIGYNCTEYK